MSFQQRVGAWLTACFPASVCANSAERTHRFLEEALELAQAAGCTERDARMLVDYVYSRSPGSVASEVGGVLVTLSGLCNSLKIDALECGNAELDRNWQRIDQLRRKQASKPLDSPLPQ